MVTKWPQNGDQKRKRNPHFALILRHKNSHVAHNSISSHCPRPLTPKGSVQLAMYVPYAELQCDKETYSMQHRDGMQRGRKETLCVFGTFKLYRYLLHIKRHTRSTHFFIFSIFFRLNASPSNLKDILISHPEMRTVFTFTIFSVRKSCLPIPPAMRKPSA